MSSEGERESERERERANGKGKGCEVIKEFKQRGGPRCGALFICGSQ